MTYSMHDYKTTGWNDPESPFTIFRLEYSGFIQDSYPDNPVWVRGNFSNVLNHADNHGLRISKTGTIGFDSGFGLVLGDGIREHLGEISNMIEVQTVIRNHVRTLELVPAGETPEDIKLNELNERTKAALASPYYPTETIKVLECARDYIALTHSEGRPPLKAGCELGYDLIADIEAEMKRLEGNLLLDNKRESKIPLLVKDREPDCPCIVHHVTGKIVMPLPYYSQREYLRSIGIEFLDYYTLEEV